MNLEKRIKRHIIAQRQHCFAVTHPGLEHLCRDELRGLSDTVEVIETTKGGIHFTGKMADLQLANLHLRTAGRILLRLDRFSATNFRQLEKNTANLPWELYLPLGAVPICNATCRSSRLYHSKAVGQRVADGIYAHWRNLGTTPQDDSGQTLFVRIDDDQATLSLDSTGTNLYQRGLKTHHGAAPLRETLAAGILSLAGYDPRRPLMDPMCGTGTFTLEAALMVKGIPPGRHRTFAFMQWPCFKERQWGYFLRQADQGRIQHKTPLILASDIKSPAVRTLSDCIHRHGLDDAVSVRRIDLFNPPADHDLPAMPGLVVLNPPYGRRLKATLPVEKHYAAIGRLLRNRFAGWRVALMAPDPRLAGILPFATRRHTLPHGGLKLTLLTAEIPGD
jgi:putative N6-adenine-specific DNA methylase